MPAIVRTITATPFHTELKQEVIGWINERAEHFDRGATDVIEDVLRYGCASGYVTTLIKSNECRKFVSRHMYDIQELINRLIDQNEFRGINWLFTDRNDHLVFEFDKIAHTAFEQVVRELASEFGIEE